MLINLEALISYNRLIESPEDVFGLVDVQGQVVILRNNTPAYIIMRANSVEEILETVKNETPAKPRLTLHEAMKLVLSEVEGNQMHAADLADEIYRRGLYKKKDGSKAGYSQIRARCGHYDMFDTLPGNIIKLKIII